MTQEQVLSSREHLSMPLQDHLLKFDVTLEFELGAITSHAITDVPININALDAKMQQDGTMLRTGEEEPTIQGCRCIHAAAGAGEGWVKIQKKAGLFPF